MFRKVGAQTEGFKSARMVLHTDTYRLRTNLHLQTWPECRCQSVSHFSEKDVWLKEPIVHSFLPGSDWVLGSDDSAQRGIFTTTTYFHQRGPQISHIEAFRVRKLHYCDSFTPKTFQKHNDIINISENSVRINKFFKLHIRLNCVINFLLMSDSFLTSAPTPFIL